MMSTVADLLRSKITAPEQIFGMMSSVCVAVWVAIHGSRAKLQIVWNDVNCCRTALEQNHCSRVKFRNDVPDCSIAVDVAESIALDCNAQNAPELNFGMNSINQSEDSTY